MSMAMVCGITAEIVNAYDDSLEATEAGRAEIIFAPAAGTAEVTVTICGHTATETGPAERIKEVFQLANEAVQVAAIFSGACPGCQIGRIRYGAGA